MAIEVFKVRVSFIWAEANFHLFINQPPNAPFSFLAEDTLYKEKFKEIAKTAILAKGGVPVGSSMKLQLPWEKPAGQLFWTYYLGGKQRRLRLVGQPRPFLKWRLAGC